MRLKTIVIAILLFPFGTSNGQTINTVAGNGSPFVSGDLILATTAGIGLTYGIAYAPSGDVYFVGSGRVRKVNTAGIISTISGGGTDTTDGVPATTAINAAVGLIRDNAGNIYIAEQTKNRVRKINTAGIINTIAGTGIAGHTGDGGPATSAQLNQPYDLAFDAIGNLYISCKGSVRKIAPSGTITTVAGTGVMGYSGDGGLATLALVSPMGIDVDLYGNVYIADTSNRLRKVNAATNTITTIAGTATAGFSGDGGPATAAKLSQPMDVAVDAANTIYISDLGNNRIRKINFMGTISTIAGSPTYGFAGDGGPASAAMIFGPLFLTVNNSGDIYFDDAQNRRIRVISGLNTPPAFLNDTVINIAACEEIVSLDTLLKVADADTGQLLHWSVLSGPAHGGASAAYSTVATGGVLAPVGTSYSPLSGYTGTDTLRVRITDGMGADTITLCFNVQHPPTPATISGPDTVCAGDTVLLAAVAGGAWSGSTGITVSGGSVSGIIAGTAMVSYTITNACGSATSTHGVYVKNCPEGIAEANNKTELQVYPNPASGRFTINFTSATQKEANVTIFDAVGRSIRTLAIAANSTTAIDINTPGVYFVKCVLPDGQMTTQKLIVSGNE